MTHLLTEDPEFSVSGFSLDRTFGKVRILRRDSDAVPIRLWQDYTPNMVGDMDYQVMRKVDANAKLPPVNNAIRFREKRR